MTIFIEVFSIAMFENQRVLQSAASPGTTFLEECMECWLCMYIIVYSWGI